MELIKKLHEFAEDHNVTVKVNIYSNASRFFCITMNRGVFMIERVVFYEQCMDANFDYIVSLLKEMLAEVNKNT